jgi:hypothetical protein
MGNVIGEAYYGTDDAPVLNTKGYHRLRREYGENKKVVVEEFFDLEGSLVVQGE